MVASQKKRGGGINMISALGGSESSEPTESRSPSPTRSWTVLGEGPMVPRAGETGRALLRQEEVPIPSLDQVGAWLGNVPFEAIFDLGMGGGPHQCQHPPTSTLTWFDHSVPRPFATGEEGTPPLMISGVEIEWENEPQGTIAYGTPPEATPIMTPIVAPILTPPERAVFIPLAPDAFWVCPGCQGVWVEENDPYARLITGEEVPIDPWWEGERCRACGGCWFGHPQAPERTGRGRWRPYLSVFRFAYVGINKRWEPATSTWVVRLPNPPVTPIISSWNCRMPPWIPAPGPQEVSKFTRETLTLWSNQAEITKWIECRGHLSGSPQLVPITHIEDTYRIPGSLSELADKFPTPKQREAEFEVADVWSAPPRMVGMIRVERGERDDSDDSDSERPPPLRITQHDPQPGNPVGVPTENLPWVFEFGVPLPEPGGGANPKEKPPMGEPPIRLKHPHQHIRRGPRGPGRVLMYMGWSRGERGR